MSCDDVRPGDRLPRETAGGEPDGQAWWEGTAVVRAPIWLEHPQKHDYPAALDYLTLHADIRTARRIVDALGEAEPATRKAKDVIRASGLPVLDDTNRHVARNLAKIASGEPLSPILLVAATPHLIIADGYHRASAVYHLDEDAEVPCRLVAWPT